MSAVRALREHRVLILAVLSVVVTLAVLWLATPLREWANLPRVLGALEQISLRPTAPLLVLAAFVVGGLLVFPINLLSLGSILVFGGRYGAVLALAGAGLSAMLLFEIGHRLARKRLRALAGPRLLAMSEGLAKRGLVAVILIRIVPVAPFSVVSLVAGASHLRRADYLLGTLLGLAPGIVLTALFVDQALEALQHPSLANVAILVGVIALLAAGAWLVQRYARRAALPVDDGHSAERMRYGLRRLWRRR